MLNSLFVSSTATEREKIQNLITVINQRQFASPEIRSSFILGMMARFDVNLSDAQFEILVAPAPTLEKILKAQPMKIRPEVLEQLRKISSQNYDLMLAALIAYYNPQILSEMILCYSDPKVLSFEVFRLNYRKFLPQELHQIAVGMIMIMYCGPRLLHIGSFILDDYIPDYLPEVINPHSAFMTSLPILPVPPLNCTYFFNVVSKRVTDGLSVAKSVGTTVARGFTSCFDRHRRRVEVDGDDMPVRPENAAVPAPCLR